MRRSAAPSQIVGGPKRSVQSILAILNKSETEKNPEPPSAELLKVETSHEVAETIQQKHEDIKENFATVSHYKIVWGKPSTKKHKVWEGDGTLEVTEKAITLRGDDGSILGTKTLIKELQIEIGQIFTVGSKVVEIIEPCSTHAAVQSTKRPPENESPAFRPSKLIKRNKSFNCPLPAGSSTIAPWAEPLILPAPSSSHQWKHNSEKRAVCPVRLDPFLTMRMRPHQRDGLTFLYCCVLAFSSDYTGAILADEMGLGKTLQCIALIWTLIKQGPYGIPVVKRVLIITPSTLCGTWEKELLKWLGRERLLPFVVDNNNKPQAFKARPNLPVMIISYERFVKHADEIESIGFDIIVCDEAHRLKNANVKAVQALQNLSCKKRILLTGTPIQNDLQEYFVLIDVANPGILGTYNEFREEFINPILISQKPDCSEEENIAGEHAAAHLQLLTSSFILRRTQNVLKDYLPTKNECVVCCKVTRLQEELYTTAIDDWWNKREMGIPSFPLSLIVLLKKICNYPLLIKKTDSSLEGDDVSIWSFLHKLLPTLEAINEEYSGKLEVVKVLLKDIIFQKKEKLVIVSCSTQMLDILGEVCKKNFVTFSRLDGSTPVSSRQSLVESFNCIGGPPVLLLSSRAGGAGLSLPSASRLILFDSDWNPAVDHQAMARIWRDGQRRPVFIYRLLVAGSIEEKIYQRQMFKTGISDAVTDPDNMKSTLKLCDMELKELFVTGFCTESSTHDMLDCHCAGDGINLVEAEDTELDKFGRGGSKNSTGPTLSSINQLNSWDHLRPTQAVDTLQELGLYAAAEKISFVFRKKHLKLPQ